MATSMQPHKHRHRRHYTIMIVSGDSDGSSKQIHLGHVKTQLLAFTGFLILLLVVCYIIFTSISLRQERSTNESLNATITELTQANADLTASNEELNGEVEQLSVALNQRNAEAAEAQAQQEQASLPNGFPSSTSASYTSTLDDPIADATGNGDETPETGNPILVFTLSEGAQVTATGDGTVISVSSDAKYGSIIEIDHGNGYVTYYRNNGSALVKENDTVHQGDPLFIVGSDNTSLGYQITENEEYIDPETMIEING